jgi:hypothetical protein
MKPVWMCARLTKEKELKEANCRISALQSIRFRRSLRIVLYKADKINEKEINLREEEFVSNFNYFPREKYLEKVRLNGN